METREETADFGSRRGSAVAEPWVCLLSVRAQVADCRLESLGKIDNHFSQGVMRSAQATCPEPRAALKEVALLFLGIIEIAVTAVPVVCLLLGLTRPPPASLRLTARLSPTNHLCLTSRSSSSTVRIDAGIVAIPATVLISAAPAIEVVVPVLPIEAVVAGPPAKDVLAAPSAQGLAPGAAVDAVIARPAT